MKLVSIILASLVLAGCSTFCEVRPDMDVGAKVVIPQEQTRYCDELPSLEDKPYTDEEMTTFLNTWIGVHEKCAARFKTLSDFILKMHPQ